MLHRHFIVHLMISQYALKFIWHIHKTFICTTDILMYSFFLMPPAFSREQKLKVISHVVFFPQKFYGTAPVHFDSYIAPFQAKG